ncbi:MAG: hypothetical protein RLZZ387_3501 [Chloroflexota bacterium]|jgi:predicted nucleotidyltransferase
MFPHHQDTIERTVAHFQRQPIVALLLGGSVAHGFATETSDVDIMIVVGDEEHQRRLAADDTQFFSRELSTYEGGYVDGKYISPSFLSLVEERGSEPARFAFADARVLLSTRDGLETQLARIAHYPVERKAANIARFHAQLNAWHWYVGEAERHDNAYLMTTACTKLGLFGARMLLAHNELLYPYHKWLPAVLARAAEKPARAVEALAELTRRPNHAAAVAWYELITGFRQWESEPTLWPNTFMRDSELTWMNDRTAVDDL